MGLAEQKNIHEEGNNFLSVQSVNRNLTVMIGSVVESLSNLENLYSQLKQTSEKTMNQQDIDIQLLQKMNVAMKQVLEQTKTYRGNLKLQQMSELDSDSEDSNLLNQQTASVEAYLKKLETTCSGILN